MKAIIVLISLLAVLAGCVGLSDRELVECREKLQAYQSIKMKLTEIMNSTFEANPDIYRLAFLQYRHLAIDTVPYFDDRMLPCWGAP